MGERSWLTTFIDMLLLMLTFLVFIIAVSRFKSDENVFSDDLAKPQTQAIDIKKHQFMKGTALDLIKGIKSPRLPDNARQILNELAMASQAGTYEGVDLYYNESKISLLFPDQLTFMPGSSSLDQSAKTVLKDLADRLKTCDFRVSIEGHTDTSVSEMVDNADLSVQRALSVAHQMVKDGLSLQRVSVSGYGPYFPIADNSNPSTRQLNRRVEVHIMLNEELF